jgi:hypothetical protein
VPGEIAKTIGAGADGHVTIKFILVNKAPAPITAKVAPEPTLQPVSPAPSPRSTDLLKLPKTSDFGWFDVAVAGTAGGLKG